MAEVRVLGGNDPCLLRARATVASPPDYHRLPLQTLATGSRGTENGLRLAEPIASVTFWRCFIVQALSGDPLTIYGDGNQTRSFCYVDDLVTGLLAMIDSDAVGPINLGTPGEYKVKEQADLELEITGSTSPVRPTGCTRCSRSTHRAGTPSRCSGMPGWRLTTCSADG